ncbi:hypothetical protein Q4577_13335 [Marinovum sp. 2_MG-2023]|uniref:DUF7742 family protein n=1 Tax=Roseobacteraceae TaxID=2854170 RepID=UPI001FD5E6E1|nr:MULTISPECIES: hypothetical protein [Roseobacteraceae]MCJ7873735.1 hypothetical protein [Phaeobacter sp. J2-8]MDO6731010.1 hypothetical protein [Marinovum sp. 2_MG-2023]MDO6778507.1 hypothetical protein [Marinovum sp. 1_MG-2023]
MRPVLHGDVTAAARAMLMVPAEAREGLCRRMIEEADFADRYAKRLGRAHRDWGNGTLMAAARVRPLAAEPPLGEDAYCRCLETVFHLLLEWRSTRRR